jgi:hypothetical protein
MASTAVHLEPGDGRYHTQEASRAKLCLYALDHIAKAHPGLAVPSHELECTHQPIVGRAGADFDAGQDV